MHKGFRYEFPDGYAVAMPTFMQAITSLQYEMTAQEQPSAVLTDLSTGAQMKFEPAFGTLRLVN